MFRRTVLIVCLVSIHSTPSSAHSAEPWTIFIIHGTYDATEHWPRVVDGRASFASELSKVCGGKTVPFLWRTSIQHERRVEAAKELAREIDKAPDSRIALVGFSHGGNVALEAANHCRRSIDLVVCLATPHLYLTTKDEQGQALHLPIYCSCDARKKIDRIVSLHCAPDPVIGFYAALRTGITDAQAVDATRGWQADKNHPRLAVDGHAIVEAIEDLLGTQLVGNVVVTPHLSVADHQITFASQVKSGDVHTTSHCRRIGELIGVLISEPTAAVALLETLCLPADADGGEPIDRDVHEAYVAKYRNRTKFSGWILQQVVVSSDSLTKPTGKDWDIDGSRADLVCVLRGVDGNRQTPTVRNAHSVKSNPYWFVESECDVTLEIRDKDLAGAYNSMGSLEFRPQSGEQEVVRPLFSIKMNWIAGHY